MSRNFKLNEVILQPYDMTSSNTFGLLINGHYSIKNSLNLKKRMHQNVCRMNFSNVLCTKLSNKWFLLHLNRLKLLVLLCDGRHFVSV